MPKMARQMVEKPAVNVRPVLEKKKRIDWWMWLMAAVIVAVIFWLHRSTEQPSPPAKQTVGPGFPAEDPWQAITAQEAALRIYTEKSSPQEWALAQNSLGTAYCELQTGDRAANLSKAISCLEAALRVYTEKQYPREWALAQYHLGIAYRALPTGDRTANLYKATYCFEAALWVYTERSFPQEHSTTQTALDLALKDLATRQASAR